MNGKAKPFSSKRWTDIPKFVVVGHSEFTEEEKKEEFKGGGDRFFLGNPGYLIHDLQGDRINTHYQTIPTGADYSGPWPFKYYEGEED